MMDLGLVRLYDYEIKALYPYLAKFNYCFAQVRTKLMLSRHPKMCIRLRIGIVLYKNNHVLFKAIFLNRIEHSKIYATKERYLNQQFTLDKTERRARITILLRVILYAMQRKP